MGQLGVDELKFIVLGQDTILIGERRSDMRMRETQKKLCFKIIIRKEKKCIRLAGS